MTNGLLRSSKILDKRNFKNTENKTKNAFSIVLNTVKVVDLERMKLRKICVVLKRFH